ncbi:MAG: hypothetical protein ACLR0U_25760 [Enterocloster clostridioformis]
MVITDVMEPSDCGYQVGGFLDTCPDQECVPGVDSGSLAPIQGWGSKNREKIPAVDREMSEGILS